ncbi:MAG TPA: hypothetical protein VFZ63_13530 [Jiangellaceae bacterium]
MTSELADLAEIAVAEGELSLRSAHAEAAKQKSCGERDAAAGRR